LLARAAAVVALVCLLVRAGAAQPSPEADEAANRALRDWARTVGALGYVYGAPLLELTIAEYRQTRGLARDVSAQRGLLGPLMRGGLATEETSYLALPDPDVLASSAWLDVAQQPFVLFVPPMDGRWWSVQVQDAYTNVAGTLSSRTLGSVGGWHLIAHRDWQGERPPGLMEDEIRVATPLAWLVLRVAASASDAAEVHERYQSRFQLLPLEVYARSPKAAGFANAQAQPGTAPQLRATAEMRGTLDAFRVINQRLRALAPPAGEEALLALFDRAGFGPGAAFDPAALPAPVVEGLRSAARDAQKMIREHRSELSVGSDGWRATNPRLGAWADAYLSRASAAQGALGASTPAEIYTAHVGTDRDGRALDGRNDYALHFTPGALPPAAAFWTLSAYATDTATLLDTRTGRYSIGSATKGLISAPDGGLDVYVSSEAPEDRERRANWLPVRTAPFFLVLRLYDPKPAPDGGYAFPPVVAVDEP
jgi:hypothetical protein